MDPMTPAEVEARNAALAARTAAGVFGGVRAAPDHVHYNGLRLGADSHFATRAFHSRHYLYSVDDTPLKFSTLDGGPTAVAGIGGGRLCIRHASAPARFHEAQSVVMLEKAWNFNAMGLTFSFLLAGPRDADASRPVDWTELHSTLMRGWAFGQYDAAGDMLSFRYQIGIGPSTAVVDGNDLVCSYGGHSLRFRLYEGPAF